MSPSSRKLIAQVLAIMLVVLPFSTGFGSYMSWGDSSMVGMHMDNESCDKMSHDADCTQMDSQIGHMDSEGECCSDHCDAFSVVTFTTNPTHDLSIPTGREYIPGRIGRVIPPFPNPLLRPPLTTS